MPTLIRPYQNKEIKNNHSKNPFLRSKNMVRQEILEGEHKERMKRWITFFRKNPVRLIFDYFGIHLHPFQVLMIWVLQKSNLAYIVASRAASKTFIIAIWAMTLCVLYPGIKVVVCAKTLKQGSLIIGKIKELQSQHPNVNREIQSLTINANDASVYFQNGSYIKAVPSTESSRGNRANYIIVEESRLVSRDILEPIIKPFLEVRTPPYRLKPEYMSDNLLKEEPTISYITSSWYKAEYWYTYVISCIRRMARGDETANFLAFDYLITLFHNIKTEETLKNEMADMDDNTIQMEYFNIPSGSSGKSYFKPTLFERKIKKAFYPQREDTFDNKKNPYAIKKLEGELRFIGVDVSTRANKANDLSIIGAVSCIPLIGRGYERRLLYMESHVGRHVGTQAERIKEIFTDFEADFIVIDIQNAGVGVFDSLSEPTISESRGITFPPMTVVDEIYDVVDQKAREELRQYHTRGLNALPLIFPISATQALNSQIATSFRSNLQKKLWKFLIPDGEAEEYLLRTDKEFVKNQDPELNAWYLSPFVQTQLLIGEAINLDMSLVGGIIKLEEKSGRLKDRYSMISYINWIISQQFDRELLRENNNEDDFSYISSLVQSS
jgi:hypothetical protein